jgi:hypothetical protein
VTKLPTEVPVSSMGMTFGDKGFFDSKKEHIVLAPKKIHSGGQISPGNHYQQSPTKELEIIYENDYSSQQVNTRNNKLRLSHQISSNSTNLATQVTQPDAPENFQENMLLSFYNWP